MGQLLPYLSLTSLVLQLKVFFNEIYEKYIFGEFKIHANASYSYNYYHSDFLSLKNYAKDENILKYLNTK
jgi:hypothetical protein